jgi:urease accessory protein
VRADGSTKSTSSISDFTLWQLADSAFPTGGFAHSAGLEAAWQHGEVPNRTALASFLESSLRQIGHSALPLVLAAHRDPQKLAELDALCDAFTPNHTANRASRAQGRALLAAAERIFATPALHPPCGHYTPVFGAVTRLLEVTRPTASQLFFFSHLRALTSSAVRLGIVGPREAQTLQHRLASRARAILAECEILDVSDLAQTAPLHDLWQGAHDRLYSRLFQS